RSQPIVREDRQVLVALALAGSLPFACFEMWKLGALGLHGYFLHWYDHLGFLVHQPIGAGRRTVAELLVERAHIFLARFFLAPALVFGLMALAVGLVMWSQDRVSQALAISLTVAILAHAAYWVFLSNGWPRYAYIGVICWCGRVPEPCG